MDLATAGDIYIVCSGILVLNLLALAAGTAVTRSKEGKFLNPEDKRFNANGSVREIDEGAAARWRRAHLNAMENILPFLPVGFLLIAAPQVSATLVGGLIAAFTVFRLLHSYAYVKAVQPLRTASFGIAALLLVAMTIYTVVQHLRF